MGEIPALRDDEVNLLENLQGMLGQAFDELSAFQKTVDLIARSNADSGSQKGQLGEVGARLAEDLPSRKEIAQALAGADEPEILVHGKREEAMLHQISRSLQRRSRFQ